MSEYLVEGAKLRCTQGSKSEPVKVPKSHNVELKGKSLLNENDCKPGENIPCFGICKKTMKPCVPMTPGPWINPNKKMMIDDTDAITVDSALVCMCGGLILPEESGQAELFEMMFEMLGSEQFALMMGSLNALKNGSCLGGDPVNLCTGNFIYQKEDFRIEGHHPLTFTRSYNSVSGENSIFGIGWRHNHEVTLKDRKKLIAVTFDDGHSEVYSSENNRHYTQVIDGKSTLIKNWENYELKKDDLLYLFDKEGRCVQISDKHQNMTGI